MAGIREMAWLDVIPSRLDRGGVFCISFLKPEYGGFVCTKAVVVVVADSIDHPWTSHNGQGTGLTARGNIFPVTSERDLRQCAGLCRASERRNHVLKRLPTGFRKPSAMLFGSRSTGQCSSGW